MATKVSKAMLARENSDLGRVAEDIYKKNLELAETNKTLLLLRKIDEIVLSSVTDVAAVMEHVAETLAEESGFPFAAIYQRDTRKAALVPRAVATRIGDPEVQRRTLELLMTKSIPWRHNTNPSVRSMRTSMIVTTSDLFEVLKPALPIDEAEELQSGLGLKTFFVCPLQARQDDLGVMVLGSSETPQQLGFYQKNLLERLTVAVGIAADNAFLYRETQAAARRLRTANRHLKELDRAKDEFISIASHQLRTPLTTIKGYISMLLEGDAGPVSAEQREFLEVAFAGSQRMVNLIADLLNVSRMSAGKFLIEKKPIDLAAVTEEEVRQLQQHAIAKQLKLSFVPPKKPLPLVALDEDKTRQVIMNFIDNAIYYTPKGQVTVTLERVAKHIELRVTDTGIGVPKAARSQLFTKFYRAKNAQAVRPDGTGLGLFLARRVVHDQGGTIIFDSEEGKGSTFGFSIPLA